TVPGNADEIVWKMAERGFLLGPSLAMFEGMQDKLIVAVTERRHPDDIELLAKTLAEVVA
ncbi:MAG: glycine dehydrogenase, partial [Actinobacteria bacterium]|nr:glycine dehydrogenase [Actinomycetota bacterium]